MSIEAMASCWGPNFPVDAVDLSPPAVRIVALAIADVVNDTYNNEFYGSLERLGTKVGLHRNTVRKVMEHFVASGVVERVRSEPGRPNVYRWLWTTSTPRADCAGSPSVPLQGLRDHPAQPLCAIPSDPNETPLAQLALSVSDSFDAFWAVWPKRVGKGAALKAYARALKRASHDEIIDGATWMAARWERLTVDERQFVPYPERWLNGDRWADPRDPDDVPAVAPPQPSRDCLLCHGDGWVTIEGTNNMTPCLCRSA